MKSDTGNGYRIAGGLLVLAGAVVLLTACARRHSPTIEAPSFTADALQRDGMAVLGVVGKRLECPEFGTQRDSADQSMATQLARELPNVRMLWPDEVKARLAADFYRDLRKALGKGDALPAGFHQAVRDSLGTQVEFLITARTERNSPMSAVLDEDTSPWGWTSREIVVQVNIHRISDGALVWSRRVKERQELEAKPMPRVGNEWGGVLSIFNEDEPEALTPSVVQVLDALFTKVGKRLASRH